MFKSPLDLHAKPYHLAPCLTTHFHLSHFEFFNHIRHPIMMSQIFEELVEDVRPFLKYLVMYILVVVVVVCMILCLTGCFRLLEMLMPDHTPTTTLDTKHTKEEKEAVRSCKCPCHSCKCPCHKIGHPQVPCQSPQQLDTLLNSTCSTHPDVSSPTPSTI